MKTSGMFRRVKRTACVGMLFYASHCFASLQSMDEAALARNVEMSCHINADMSSDCLSTLRISILRPEGREMVSRIELPASGSDRLSVKQAALILPNGKRSPLTESQIITQALPSSSPGVGQTSTTSLMFEGLEEKGGLEYTVEQHYARVPGARQFHGVLAFPPLPMRDDSFRMEYTADKPLVWRSEDFGGFKVVTSEGGRRILVELVQPRHFNLVNEDSFTLRKIPRIEFGYSDKIQDHFGRLAAIYNKILLAPLPDQAAAEVERLKDAPQNQKARSLMAFIREHYRYIADWRLEDRGLIPFSLGRIEQDGYGDSKDLAYLLVAMFRKLGVDAAPAFIAQGTFAPALLIPGVHATDHVVVRAVVNGEVWWMDPSNPSFLPGRIPSDMQDRWAIVLGSDGIARLDSIPMEDAANSSEGVMSRNYAPDGTAKVIDATSIGGADLLNLIAVDRVQGSESGDKAFCAAVAGEVEGCSVKRAATDHAVQEPYPVEVRVKDSRPLEKVDGTFLYDASKHFHIDLSALSKYRKDGDVGDAYLGDAGVTQMKVRLDGLKVSRQTTFCQVHSPWIDYDVTENIDPNHAASYTSRFRQKVRWISHDELAGVEFGKFLTDAGVCLMNLKVALTP